MKKVFYYLSSLLVLAGCSQETDFFPSNGTGDNAGFKFELTTDDNTTRTVTDDNFKTVFSEGDQVGLFVVKRTDGDVSLKASGNYADNRKLTYSGGEWIIDREVTKPSNGEILDFYAYYPYVENADPTAIAYDATKSMCDLMMANTGDVDASSEVVKLIFSHQLSLIDTRISGGAASGVTVKSVKTKASFDLGKFGTEEVMTLSGTETADVKMENVGNKHFRAYIPSQEVEGSQLLIEQGEKTQTYTPVNTGFKKGTAYQYNIVSKLVNIADLPNCYIVKPGEEVTFPVLKAYEVWRQVKFINNGDLRNDGPVGAELIWQDVKSLITKENLILNVDPTSDDLSTITVKTKPGVEGNALVAVTMGGDKTWVYHIWVTDFDPDSNVAEVDNNGDGNPDYIFMDRNLGALTSDVTNPRSVGMYYQGGNGTPYPGFTDKFPTDGAVITEIPLYDIDNNAVAITTGNIWSDNYGQGMRRHLTDPTLFMTSSGEPFSWISQGAQFAEWASFWSDETTGEKGIFDPSPEGWMVPAYKNNLSPWNSFLSGNDSIIDPTTVYPVGGRMRFDGKFGNCDHVMLFSGTMDGLKTFAFDATNTWGQINNYSAGNALNVRCVKIQ